MICIHPFLAFPNSHKSTRTMTQYSCCQKAYMNGLHKGGMKAKEIAIQVDVPLGTVYRLIRAGYDPNDTTPFVETRGRNQQKYSAREKRWVVNFALKNKKATLDEIITGTRIDACRNTVRKMLKDQK